MQKNASKYGQTVRCAPTRFLHHMSTTKPQVVGMYNLRVRFAFAKRRQSPERGREWTGWTAPHLPLPSSGNLRKRWVFKCFFWDQLVTLWLRNSLITKKQKEQHKANMWRKIWKRSVSGLGRLKVFEVVFVSFVFFCGVHLNRETY